MMILQDYGEYNEIFSRVRLNGDDHSFFELKRMIAHTPRDTPEIIGPGKLVDLARALNDFLRRF